MLPPSAAPLQPFLTQILNTPPIYLRPLALIGPFAWKSHSTLRCGLSTQMPIALAKVSAYLISPSTLCDHCPSTNFLSLLIYLFIVSSSNLRLLRLGPKCAIPVESLISLLMSDTQ